MGNFLPNPPAAAATRARKSRLNEVLRISALQAPTYPSVARAYRRLNAPKNRPSTLDACRGLSSSAESAGLSVNALKAEMSTEMAIVTANC